MCTTLLRAQVPGLHFYTLNLERSVCKILIGLDHLGLLPPLANVIPPVKRSLVNDNNNPEDNDSPSESWIEVSETNVNNKPYPWRCSSQATRRDSETVRPIYWSKCPLSYLERTCDWDQDEFSNGRWGDNRSPAFGELSDSFHSLKHQLSPAERKNMWGNTLGSVNDVIATFVRYLEGNIRAIPWCEAGALDGETRTIQAELVRLNRSGYLTINSQPRVDGRESSCPEFGWGGAGGRVYQKAYVEFFTSPSRLRDLMDRMDEEKESNPRFNVEYHAMDVHGHFYSNRMSHRVPKNQLANHASHTTAGEYCVLFYG